MRFHAVFHWTLLIGLAAPTSSAIAVNGNRVDQICFADASGPPPLGRPMPIPVGCRLIDCCPGCSARGAFEWKINFDAKALERAELRFEGLSAGGLSRLKLRGNAKLEGDGIVLRQGTSSISGLPDGAIGKVTAGPQRPVTSQTPGARAVRDQLTVRQFLGDLPVNSTRWRFIFRYCVLQRPPIAPLPTADRLVVQGVPPGESVVVMMDSRKSAGAGGCGNDEPWNSTGTTWIPNALASGGCNSELAVFGTNNEMLFESPVGTWTDLTGDIHRTPPLKPPVDVPVTIWVADSPADARAHDELNNTNALYNKNRVGVRFSPTYKNVSADTGAVALIEAGVLVPESGDYSCTDAIDALKNSTSPVVFTPGQLNVYYVNKALTGRNCAIKKTPTSCTSTAFEKGDGNITYVGNVPYLAILAHEIGHAFGLRPGPCGGHTNGVAGFDDDSIMNAPPDLKETASYFSLGQVFRMNTHSEPSWDGSMLIKNGLVPGRPTRDCPPLASNEKCPALATPWPGP